MKTDLCILATDFSDVKRQQQFYIDKIDKKSKIYMSLMEYSDLLKEQLEVEQDPCNRYTIQREMKKIKKELKKYYEPGMLAMYKFERLNDIDDKKTSNGKVIKLKK